MINETYKINSVKSAILVKIIYAIILAASSTNNLQKKFFEFIHSEQNIENDKYNNEKRKYNERCSYDRRYRYTGNIHI